MEGENLKVEAPPSAQTESTAQARSFPPLPENAVPIVPVRNLVLFPGIILPLTVGREQSVAAAQAATRAERPIGVVLQRDAEVQSPSTNDVHWVGTLASIVRYITGRDGTHHV
ncbi:MAG: LON peptidase substrate-binding domain-containing protein, partial [Burkholderiales bacterium]